MGIFDNIKDRIFGHTSPAAIPPAASQPAASPAPTSVASPAPGVQAAQQAALDAGMAAANKSIADAVAANASAAAPQTVDVAAVLDAAVAKSGQTLHWKTSIVDLLKALDIDSSLTARKQLADELGYKGDTSDSAAMNIWLHKQVITKLAANGGKLPPSLLA
ncbi:hypothetical protein ABIB57_002283 [Devosia sp. UYZn731]|uniref:DUF3597 domain-containing protein n=1 Tax=Devosia sp. UYZn731 TaxID=3156345 RepID=UPI003394FE48